MSQDKTRKLLTLSAVIGWLQWAKFPDRLDEPDYAQTTLRLLKEYKDEVEALERTLALRDEQLKLAVAVLETYAAEDDYASQGEDARDVLSKIGEVKNG